MTTELSRVQERAFSWVRRWTRRDIDGFELGMVGSAPLADWLDKPCLVLLGEGGLGKSHELRAEHARLAAAGSTVYLCDLGTTTDRTDLRDEVLPKLPAGEPATLLIDGFDEVFDDVNDIADVLGAYFAGIDRASVSVRIASRPVVWSTRLEERLTQLWPGGVLAVTLEPVMADDIRSAAEAEFPASDANRFISAVSDRDLWSLAGNPNTLFFLFDQFGRSGSLTGDRLTIHRDGIAQLASETNDRRVDRRRVGPPTRERVIAARTLAYLSMFGGKPLIDTRRSSAGDVVDLDDVAGTDGVPQDTLDAVAQSGLFRPAGTTGVAWAHRSIAELLAADRIRSWPLPTLLKLLTQPTHPNTIAPQLVGVASWVAVTHPDLSAWLLDHNLAVLLDSNLADLPEERRRAVGEQLVDRVVAGEAFDWQSIASGGLTTGPPTTTFRRRLTDPAVPTDVKAELVQLVWRSGQRGLDDVLAAFVREAADHAGYDAVVSLGRWAVIALADCSDEAILETLVEIARAPTTNRWILADLLESLHPTRFSTSELLDLLPHDALEGVDTTFFGLVHRVERGAAHDVGILVAFLRWLASQSEAAHHEYFLTNRLADTLGMAAAQLDRADVLTAVGELIGRHAEVAHRTSIPEPLVRAPAGQRRALLERAATAANNPLLISRLIAYRLFNADDFDHFVGQLADLHTSDPASVTGDHWITAAAHAAFGHVPYDRLEAVAEAAKTNHPPIAQFIENMWGAAVRQARKEIEEANAATEAQIAAEQAAENFNLSRFDAAAGAGSWGALAQELRRPVDESDEQTTGHSFDDPLSGTAAWQGLDDNRQNLIIQLARSFIETGSVDRWSIPWIADAIALIADVRPDQLDTVDGARWVALVGPLARSVGHHDTCAMVIGRAVAHDRPTVDKALLDALVSDVAAGSTLTLDRLSEHKPEGLEQRLLYLALDDSVDEHACDRLLRAASDLKAAGTAAAAFAIVARRPVKPGPATPNATRRDDGSPEASRRRRWRRAVAAAAALATAPADIVAGDQVLEMLTTDWDLTTDVISWLGLRPGDQLVASLTPDQIATLYLWVDPLIDKPDYQPGRVYPMNAVHEFPNTLLHVIGAREDSAAVAALDRIAAKTNSHGIRHYASRVRSAAQASTWQPIPLTDLRQIAADTDQLDVRPRQSLVGSFTAATLVLVGSAVAGIATNNADRWQSWLAFALVAVLTGVFQHQRRDHPARAATAIALAVGVLAGLVAWLSAIDGSSDVPTDRRQSTTTTPVTQPPDDTDNGPADWGETSFTLT